MMNTLLSCEHEPFVAFIRDLHISGTEAHLYKGPNAFGCLLTGSDSISDGKPIPEWWNTENVYFLAGITKGLKKRAADSDVIKKNMFTLDFDIRKELEKKWKVIDQLLFDVTVNNILNTLINSECWHSFRYAVLSGNGLHVHYFGDPIDIVKEEWSEGMKGVFHEVNGISAIPCDTGCGNAGRIMRMPGSWNVKDPANKKPVTFLDWHHDNTFPSLQSIQIQGRLALQQRWKENEEKKIEFAVTNPDGDNSVIKLINSIPIEQVIGKLIPGVRVSQVKKDGGKRFTDAEGMERGFFKHHQYNVIVHEGTSLFEAPETIGYNCIGIVKAVHGGTTHEAIQWFAELSPRVREAVAEEKRTWCAEQESHDIADFIHPSPTHNG